MTRKRKRIRLSGFFKWKSVENKSSQHERPQYNEIIITERDTISLKSMVLSAKRQGDFYVAEVVAVETDGYITGTVTATDAVVKGRITGSITCTNELVVASTAIIEGTVTAKKIAIERGSIINGMLCIADDVQAPVLADKLSMAKSLLNDGYVPAVEAIDVPGTAASPPTETVETQAKQRVREQQAPKTKSRAKRAGNQRPPAGEETGSWW